MKTVVSHFYNEEYLLPFWLQHHKKYFDHGIMINYASTDESVNIIKKICPEWEIVDSENEYFEAQAVDNEVMKIESKINGWKIALNTTEFLIGNMDILTDDNNLRQIIIPCHMMVDTEETEFTEIKNSLIRERKFGILHSKNNVRSARSIHNFNVVYSLGRHFRNLPVTTELNILYYGFCPLNETTLNRKLQIKNKLSPDSPISSDLDHRRNREDFIRAHKEYQTQSEDLSFMIDKYISYTEIDYITVCYKNYDLILLQVENFKKLFGNNYNLYIVDNTPNSLKNVELLSKIALENPNIKIVNRDYELSEFDGISHGHAIDMGLKSCKNDIVCVFDSDFFFLHENINEYILNLFNSGYHAVGCEFNDGTPATTNYLDSHPENFANAPVCYAAFYDKNVAQSNTFKIDINEVDRASGYIETGYRIRKHIVDKKLKGLTWKANRNERPCFFRNEKNELIGVHYTAGSHTNFNQKTIDELREIIFKNKPHE
jgi:hypothetical protein